MEEAEKAVFRKCQDLREKLRWFTADDVDENRINTKDIKDSYTEELRNIKDAYHEAARSIKDLLLDYNMALPSQRKEYWKQEEDAIFNETKTNERQVRAAVTRITANLTSPVAVSPASLQDSNSSDVLKGKRKKALSKMQTLHEAIGKDSEKLQDKIYLVKDWKLEDDVSISRGMKKAEKWEEDLDKIVQMMRELKTLKREHDVADREVNCSEAERLVEDLEVEVEDVKQQIVSEDNERELYSLDISKTSKVNLPTFGGKNHEDFSKFKMDVEKAFKTNRTSRDEQIIKLRECLKGQARKLVPDSNVTDIKEAWKILKQAFGNPIKIIQQRKEALLKLGTLPKRMSNRSIEIAWYIDMTTFLRELIDLGIKNPDYSELIFLNQFAMEIRHLFPNVKLREKLRECGGEGQTHLENMLELINEWLLRAQTDQQENEIVSKSNVGCTRCSASSNSKSGSGTGAHFSRTVDDVEEEDEDYDDDEEDSECEEYPMLAAFKPAKRYEDCRICRQLEEDGDTRDLYDDHIHSYPSGCPRYIQMTIRERSRICGKAKLCKSCHDPDYVYKYQDSNHDCPVKSGKKGSYTCTKCNFHMWVCEKHQEENREGLERFRRKYEKDFNLNFGLVVVGSIFDQISPFPNKSLMNSELRISKKKAKLAKKKLKTRSKTLDKTETSRSGKPELSMNISKSKAGKGVKKKTSRKFNNPHNYKNISSSEATQLLEKKLSKSGEKIELRPIPAGRAQFMMGQTRGKTGPLNILYDSGCYALLLRDGVQRELGVAVLKTKGPYIVNGVGNTSVKVNDEWQTSLPLIDGSRQAVEGWTVDEVTAPLPRIDLSKAVADIKDDDKNNAKLQSMFVELVTGGQVDILLGQMYNSIFPIHVHSLPSGLAIYELQVASHNDKVNSVIGGPHESFEHIAQQVGGANFVFAHLMESLETYKKIGPPSLTKSSMRFEDERFAVACKDWEMGEQFEEMLDKECLPDEFRDYSEIITEGNDDQYNSESNLDTNDELHVAETLNCGVCGDDYFENIQKNLHIGVDNDGETMKTLKKMQHSLQDGMQIEYRCPRCRDCNACKRSFETERVSLREEAEDRMIHDSINIDFEKNEIVCSLPTRGKEEEFLSNNRDLALKILDQQCYKYSRDTETKEVIVKAFDKLLKNNQMKLWTDLTEEEKKIVKEKPISHYIPWRVVFKPSLSTPARPVFDASTNTKVDELGRGGRSLNDLVVKGKVTTLNLVKMIMRFQAGAVAVQGDLKQFYASIKLVVNQWNLQRVLFKKDLDPENEPLEAVIKTLIWGVKCVSGQSEASIIQLAEFIKSKNPRLYDFLLNCRFCDDLGNSAATIAELKHLTNDADDVFSQVGLECKGWSFSGEEPKPELAEDGQLISIGGMKWHPQLDTLEVLIPRLHFSRKLRGRLLVGTKVFEGSMMEQLEEFVPKKLTRRIIFSKNYSIFDLLGKLAPVMSILKADMRAAVEQTDGWDDPVPDELRGKWIKNFWLLERLRGLKFQRAVMPEGAVSTSMDLIIAVDAAEEVKMAGAWGRFRLKSGLFSCQLVLGRSLLADKDSTIPKVELDALTIGSNMGWILRQSMESWVESSILIGDSSIAMSWVTSTEKRLSLFHRNRCVQIRRGTNLDNLYHCATDFNPADLGTKPHLVQLSHVGPNSAWEKGLPWMREEIDDAVKNGILMPAKSLRLNEKEEDDYKKGFVYEKTPEILTPGHIAMITTLGVEKVKERQEFSNYLIAPNKFKFEKVVRILSIVRKFIRKLQTKRTQTKFLDTKMKFQMFFANKNEGNSSYFNMIVKKSGMQCKGKYFVDLTDEDISWSLDYLFRKGSKEVSRFCKSEFIRKIAIEKDGILFAKSRILDSQRFQAAGGLEELDSIAEFGIKLMTPVLDRYSPLAYSIGDYIHRKVAKHAGYENSFRESLNHCFIIQGLGLFRELGDDCVKCRKMRKKFLDIVEGPVSDEALIVAPPFYVSMCDLYGPCHVYVPGHAMKTRHRAVVEAKCYVLVSVCPVSKLVNLQVIEGKSADAVIDGVIRLCCEVGVPSLMLVDKESSILKALSEAEVDVRNLDMLLHKEKGIRFRTCPVSGHNYHGLVERKIRSVQECLDKCNVGEMRLHATGLQTFCKLVENDINNLPMGYSYARDSDNSPLLKLIFPNMLRIGRNNSRALEGPIKLPKGPDDLMKKVEKAYDVFYKLWNVTMIPKLMKMHRWFDTKDVLLREGDIVYFRKVENELSSKWTVGRVSDVEKGRDGVVRRCTVRYQNSSESQPRYTDRAARSLIKLFHIDDLSWQQEMDLVEKIIEENKGVENVATVTSYDMNHLTGLRYRLKAVSDHDRPVRELGVQHRAGAKAAKMKMVQTCKNCCCTSHCLMTGHAKNDVTLDITAVPTEENCFVAMLDRSWSEYESFEQNMFDNLPVEKDRFMSYLCAVNTDFVKAEEL